jgi:hypothetical protein
MRPKTGCNYERPGKKKYKMCCRKKCLGFLPRAKKKEEEKEKEI